MKDYENLYQVVLIYFLTGNPKGLMNYLKNINGNKVLFSIIENTTNIYKALEEAKKYGISKEVPISSAKFPDFYYQMLLHLGFNLELRRTPKGFVAQCTKLH